MALLATQQIVAGGIAPTYAAATATTGDTFACDGRTFLVVVNGSGSPITVTLTSKAGARPGLAVTDATVTVAASATKFIAVDPLGFADSSTGVAKATCSSVTTVTVAAIRL